MASPARESPRQIPVDAISPMAGRVAPVAAAATRSRVRKPLDSSEGKFEPRRPARLRGCAA